MATSSQTTPPPTTELTVAAYTWRDIAGQGPYSDRWRKYNADRDDLPWGSKALKLAVAAIPNVGGVLAWNKTADDEGGHLLMLTGQTCDQELRVIENAGWLTSTGAIYSASRVGSGDMKARPEFRFKGGDRRQWLFLAWTIPNDADLWSEYYG